MVQACAYIICTKPQKSNVHKCSDCVPSSRQLSERPYIPYSAGFQFRRRTARTDGQMFFLCSSSACLGRRLRCLSCKSFTRRMREIKTKDIKSASSATAWSSVLRSFSRACLGRFSHRALCCCACPEPVLEVLSCMSEVRRLYSERESDD